MVNPDSIVTARGEQLTLTRVSSFDTGRDGVSNVTREYEAIPGIVSQPSEEAAQRLEGRLESGAITVTVPSGTDVRSDRDGGRDRLIRSGQLLNPSDLAVDESFTYTVDSGNTEQFSSIRLDGAIELNGAIELSEPSVELGENVRVYTVEDVQDDTHALTGTRKVTLTCSEFGGREDLSEDASQYVSA